FCRQFHDLHCRESAQSRTRNGLRRSPVFTGQQSVGAQGGTRKMKKILMTFAVAAAMATGAAQAQVNVMLPAGPGGGWDTTGRQAFQAMNDAGIYTGGVNFTNTGGAGGTIGLAEFVSTSSGQPDALAVFGAIT